MPDYVVGAFPLMGGALFSLFIKTTVLCQKEKVVLRYDLFFLRRWGVGANLPPPVSNGYDGVLRCRRVSIFAKMHSGLGIAMLSNSSDFAHPIHPCHLPI